MASVTSDQDTSLPGMCVGERGCIKIADPSDNTLLNIYQSQGYLDLHLTLLTQTHPNMVLARDEGGIYISDTSDTTLFYIL